MWKSLITRLSLLAYGRLGVQRKSRRTIHQYYEEGLEPAVFWCGCDAINRYELLDKVPWECTERQSICEEHYDAQIIRYSTRYSSDCYQC